ncbi:unnamed protein product [Pieris macdunnoughi]|uniref:sphingomyelin phosphodiesterase n=1 Tax=Pieris macdunnoughi TaxID=345717 RepID=A0A821SES8_9NEOP|nr:unnamed protein product [Pieris macdunnoughi]
MEFSINLFTLNCWGIPIVSKNRKERIEAIAKYLLSGDQDIVCLQEVWSENDYLYLKENISSVLPYSHYFYSGVLGSGLCVFSKWLIKDVYFHKWPLNGYIHKIHHGDWFGGKGVGLCRIKYLDRLINVYCTHLHAEYNEDDIYLAHRVLQAHLAAEFVNLTSSPADVSFLAGDFNTAPGEIAFRLITEMANLLDPCDVESIGDTAKMIKALGTCDNINNSYSNPKMTKTCPEGKRIDHILFNVNSGWEAEVISLKNPLPDRVPGEEFSYSDHNAVSLELKVKANAKNKEPPKRFYDNYDDTVVEAIQICKEAKVTLVKSRKLFLITGGLIFMVLIGLVGYWPNNILVDMIKIFMTGICFYYIVMGTIWNRIEMNSLKAGLSALEIFQKRRVSEN